VRTKPSRISRVVVGQNLLGSEVRGDLGKDNCIGREVSKLAYFGAERYLTNK
jgi:hypothetical protein